MPSDTVNRKLTAILYADVVDYSRLTRQDEVATHQRVMTVLDQASDTIGDGGGTVLRYAGDAILAEFASVVAAVQTAVTIQQQQAQFHNELAGDEKVEIRIGLNLGEVITDRGEIFGDGVNLAARLEAAAKPGGICLASSVYDQIDGRIDIELDDGGEQSFKNIDKPVHVFHWHPHDSSTAQPSPPSTGSADKPSVAVLPFDNMSGDPEQVFFSDGITEDIITDLSRFRGIDVTARNSSFALRDRNLKVGEIADELNVDYVLEGSVRKAGDRIRVTAQLIDGNSENHVWAERYDRQIEDIFAVQDELTRAIVVALSQQIEQEALDRAHRKPPHSLDAYEHLLRGYELADRPGLQRYLEAREHFEKAIELDPAYGRAYAELSTNYLHEWNFAWSKQPAQAKQRAMELALKAYELDPGDSRCLHVLGMNHFFAGDLIKASRMLEQAIKLNPNSALSLSRAGIVYMMFNKLEEGLAYLERASELDPIGDLMGEWFRGIGYFNARQYDKAINIFLSSDIDAPEFFAWLAAAYAQNGDIELAREQGDRFKRLLLAEVEEVGVEPPASFQSFLLERAPYNTDEGREHFVEGLRLAGID